MSFTIVEHTLDNGSPATKPSSINKQKIYIGRGTGDDIFLDDLRVSLDHATIERIGNVYILKDTNSANGTYVNRKLVQEQQLADNDEIHIGPYTLLVHRRAPEDPLEIVIEQPDVEVAGEPHTYLARYALSSGFFTKRCLTIGGVLVVFGCFVAALVFGKKGVLEPGQVAAAHSLFENDCAQCHARAWNRVADTACQTCHDGPLHHQNQVSTSIPRCAACHAEHSGRQRQLTSVSDQFCTRCHADLRTAEGIPSQFAHSIYSFTTGHPEFAVQVGTERVRLSDQTHLRDVAQVQLNHAMHLKPNKRGPEDFEALKCSNCHQVDAQRAYMVPITYKQDCMRCHPLEFDQRFPKQAVPHDTPEVVHAFLDTTFIRYCRDRLLSHTNESGGPGSEPLQQRRPGAPRSAIEETRSIAQCAEEEVRGAEAFLFADKKQNGCTLCHVVQPPAADSPLPTVVQTAIPQRWLLHSVFNHQAHARAGRSCEDCHSTARTSEKTADVLLPGIASCQECHETASEVRSVCVTCHVYHDRGEIKRGLPQYMEDRFISHGAQWRNPPTAAAPR